VINISNNEHDFGIVKFEIWKIKYSKSNNNNNNNIGIGNKFTAKVRKKNIRKVINDVEIVNFENLKN